MILDIFDGAQTTVEEIAEHCERKANDQAVEETGP